jgi:hypothetical protein
MGNQIAVVEYYEARMVLKKNTYLKCLVHDQRLMVTV